MEIKPQTRLDIVLADDKKLYVRPGQRLYSARARKALMEMLWGWSAVRSRPVAEVKLQKTTQENWEHAIGLVVCGLAERIQL